MLVASATKASPPSSLTCRSSMEDWKAKSNCSRVWLVRVIGTGVFTNIGTPCTPLLWTCIRLKLVPRRLLVLIPAQGHHLGVVVEAAPRHAAQVLEGIHVAPDEGGGVRPPDQLHVAGPGPAQRHHEHPDAVPASVLAQVGRAAPVHLGLLPREPSRNAPWHPAAGAAGAATRGTSEWNSHRHGPGL